MKNIRAVLFGLMICVSVFTLFSFAIASSSTEDSNDQTSPNDRPFPLKKVFVTSFTIPSPAFVNISNVDSYCFQAKTQAGLSGNYVAWISSNNTNARDRIGDARYTRTDGIKIADNKADLLDGSLDAPINRNQFGKQVSGNVLTGTFSTGNVVNGLTCNNWQSSSNSHSGAFGNTASSSTSWTFSGSTSCNNLVNNFKLYCFEI